MPEYLTLEERKARYDEKAAKLKNRVIICAGTGCIANGSLKVHEKFTAVAKERGMDLEVDYDFSDSGCQGFCQMGPLVTVYPQGIMYVKVTADDVAEIVDETLLKGKTVERLLYKQSEDSAPVEQASEIPFYARQQRVMLEFCGRIEAENMDEYIAHGGYLMSRKAVTEMSAEKICKEVLNSGLRGRGGGGFPTGRKWELTRVNEADVKYVVCNGDEGDPGAFMDRCVMEGNPHALLEGMTIAAQGVNATEGYIYVRMEYPLAVERLKKAIEAAREGGILGDDIYGSGKRFDIQVVEGAGAFVCGEETALIASAEGRRGMPTLKPPFPAQKGLFGKPTVINNVETFVTVPLVMRMGAEEYAKIGDETAAGTKVFALTGQVANTGLIEVPFNTTLREIVGAIGGGVTDDDGNNVGLDYKVVQIGGPSGGCLTQEHLDLPLTYAKVIEAGAMIGSGGLVVLNQNNCMVKMAKYFMTFTQNESCGKCVVCREGTRQMLELLDDITEGRATMDTLKLLEELANVVRIGSLCGLGKSAPNPVLSTLRYFRDEYIAHIVDKKCPTGNCEALSSYKIVASKCKGCGVCAKKCPVDAIRGEIKQPYVIDADKCVKCGACAAACKFGAIVRG